MVGYRRERISLEVDPGGRNDSLNNRPPPPFNHGVSLLDATPEQLTFVHAELARFVDSGTWEPTTCGQYVSILVIVPKHGINQWRFIVDLRHLNSLCVKKRLSMESMPGARHLTRKSDYMFSIDMKDRFYALGLWESFHSSRLPERQRAGKTP
jgi:hypothetical protein